ncbi:peroxiredoxin [Tritrichomonas musculus]|uniref:Peroxiredoxin n=1 Tax=Tritrichomonas musculus TaxID=1915356 RepID=A0ABR2L486_9EUKA
MTSVEAINLDHCRKIREFKLIDYKYSIFIESNTNKIYLQIIFNQKCKNSQEEDEFTASISKISKISTHPALLPIIDFKFTNSCPTIIVEYPPNGFLTNENKDPLKFKNQDFTGTKKLINLLGIAAGMHFYYLNRINHGNLKQSDIFFDQNLYPHVMNFEVAEDTPEDEKCIKRIKAQTHDIQSFGYIAYSIITSDQQLSENKNHQKTDLTKIKSIWLRNFLQNCFSAETFSNPTFYQVYNDLLLNRSKYQDTLGVINEDEVAKYIEALNDYMTNFSNKINESASQPKKNPPQKIEGVFSQIAIVGEPAPDFKGTAVLPSLEFGDIELSQFKGKWLVLFSYPLDFTFVCPTEIIQFSEEYDQFKKINCEVVGISIDSVYSHLAWMNVPRKEGGIGNINYPIIGDLGGRISKRYGLYMYDEEHDMRGTVIIDPDGIVRHISMNHPDVGRNIDEILRLVQGYQYAREHGEVCPAQWHEGDDIIKPDPKGSLEYFSKH